jgi:DNA-directed RNA polymerase subunit M/transcription elongation factor TFIIS
MIMFCKTCGSLLKPKTTEYGKWMACPNGHSQPELNQENKTVTTENKEQVQRIQVSDGKNILAVHDHICPRCNHDKAELIEIQPSYSDEDPTYRMKCGKCNFVVQLEGKVR